MCSISLSIPNLFSTCTTAFKPRLAPLSILFDCTKNALIEEYQSQMLLRNFYDRTESSQAKCKQSNVFKITIQSLLGFAHWYTNLTMNYVDFSHWPKILTTPGPRFLLFLSLLFERVIKLSFFVGPKSSVQWTSVIDVHVTFLLISWLWTLHQNYQWQRIRTHQTL